jgi:hypothetical protein
MELNPPGSPSPRRTVCVMSDQESAAEEQPQPQTPAVGDSAWDTLDFVPSGTPDAANIAVEPLKNDSM